MNEQTVGPKIGGQTHSVSAPASYYEMIQDAVARIEDDLTGELTLERFAKRYHLSASHFYRIFRAVTGHTLRGYIQERRLSEAARELQQGRRRIVDIALDYGYQSHEVFSRSFRQWARSTPSEFRKTGSAADLYLPPLVLVEREFKNVNKDIVVDYRLTDLEETTLQGREHYFEPRTPGEIERLTRSVQQFVSGVAPPYRMQRLTNVIRCDGSNPERLHFFMGTDASLPLLTADVRTDTVPACRYAVFRYKGSMGIAHQAVMNDLYQWIVVCKVSLRSIGIEMLECYDSDYEQTGQFHLYVPVH